MRHRRRVALLIETSNSYARGLLNGIVEYMRQHESWLVYLGETGRGDKPPQWLRRWRGDGIIARCENDAIADAVVASGLPAVDVSAARTVEALPWVETDDAAIAALAGQHLLDRGFKHFAFCGDDRFNWSLWRCEQFKHLVARAGYPCAVLNPPPRAQQDWEQMEEEIADWLRGLPRPLGLMAAYDIRGRHVLDACRRAGLAVPDQVAVVGVDNDELLCSLSDPPLTSIQPDARRAGLEAAALLDRIMDGGRPRKLELRIEPIGIVSRRSTDVTAIQDPDVSAAVRYIRDHACEGLSVKHLMQVVPLSRRVLESRFRKLLGRTPHDEIVRVQFERVKQLLRETRLPLDAVARLAGFRHAEYLSTAFHRHVGMPPSVYRRRHAVATA